MRSGDGDIGKKKKEVKSFVLYWKMIRFSLIRKDGLVFLSSQASASSVTKNHACRSPLGGRVNLSFASVCKQKLKPN